MQRPQSLEFKGANKSQCTHAMPPMISYEFIGSSNNTPRLLPVSVMTAHTMQNEYVKSNRNTFYQLNKWDDRHSGRVINLDQQVSQLHRLSNQFTPRFTQGLPQSQSFSQNIYNSPRCTNNRHGSHGDSQHTSRLIASTYMSPPPTDWITVGNIIPVKRSTSMPGNRHGNNPQLVRTNVAPGGVTTGHVGPTKKKSGPFQCLKHQLKKSGLRSEQINYPVTDTDNSHTKKSFVLPHKSIQIAPVMSLSLQFPVQNSDKIKTSKSLFKKKLMPSPNPSQISNSKPRGIKKSISLFFSSKSYRTVKSDPSNLDRNPKTDQTESLSPKNVKHERQFSFKSAARLNHSYESMLHSDDKTCSMSLYTDTNRSNSFTSVGDNSSFDFSNSIETVEETSRPRTPSEASLPDTASVSSSGNHMFAYTSANQYNADQHSIAATSFQGNINYRASDNCWKTVVGNVCRSNSKDSAIANSTLSADGMLSQSKRMSQISTISRTSDITQTSEDFNDSSYSSFNDLQINASQIYHKKKRVTAMLPKLQTIELESKQQESSNSYDSSPLSDSSTETLRPLSFLLRRRFLSSSKDNRPFHSNTIVRQVNLSSSCENLKTSSRKHSHSWPNCSHQSLCKSILSSQSCTKESPVKQCNKKTVVSLRKEHYPHLKIDKLNHNRVNNSPLLSQYSRLYSLKTVGVQHKVGLSNFSGHLTSSIPSPQSPIKYSNRVHQHFPSKTIIPQ